MNSAHPSHSTVKAVLGPTNTGKTHLAIERMCAHSSGIMGFPLRLLAREVYDRVVAIKGEAQVALITGEERIEPPNARYFCCTAEAMPVQSGRLERPAEGPRSAGGTNGPAAFVAMDEAQLAANRERGHIFTNHILHSRGREETLILGASTLEPMIRSLIRAQKSSPGRAFPRLAISGRANCRACRRAAPSSHSRPTRSMRWPKCCAVFAVALRL